MARIPTKLGTILTAIKARLIAASAFATDTVYIGRQADLNNLPPALSHAVITAGRIQSEGNSRHEVFVVRATAVVSIFNCLQLDEGDRADEALTDSLGIYTKVDLVAKALELHDLLSGSDQILSEPMRFRSATQPKEVSIKPGAPGFLKIDMEFDLAWEWDIS